MDTEQERIRALLVREMVEQGIDPDEELDSPPNPERRSMSILNQYLILIIPTVILISCAFFGNYLYQSSKQAQIEAEEHERARKWKAMEEEVKSQGELAHKSVPMEEQPPICRPGAASYSYDGCEIYKETMEYARRTLEKRR